MDIAVFVGIAGGVVAIISSFLSYYKGLKTDNYSKGNCDATIKSDIEYIKRRNDDILLEQKDTNKNFNVLSERVTRVEESAKQAHKRLNRIEGLHGED